MTNTSSSPGGISAATPARSAANGQGAGGLAGGSVGFWRSLAQPIAAQAPSAGIALIPATMASVTGTYGATSFLLGLVAGAFLTYVFIHLARRSASAGSLYGFAKLMLGPVFAFVVAWAYLGNDLMVGGAVLSQTGDYFGSAVGLAGGGSPPWVPVAAIAGVAVLWTASRRITVSTTVLLVLELVTCALVIVAGTIVLAKGGYGGHSFGFAAFSLHGVSAGHLFLGISVAFLGFGGFEQATALGEETRDAQRTIPRTIVVALLFSGLLYTFGAWFEAVGFSGPKALAASSTPLFTVVGTYVSPALATVLAFATTATAFSASLALTNHGVRMLYSLFRDRDAFAWTRLARTHPVRRTPTVALLIWALPMLALSIGFFATSAGDAFAYAGTAGGLLLSLVYLLMSGYAVVYFARRRDPAGTVVSVVAAAIVGYALFSSVYPAPSYPFDVLPYADLAVMAVGLGLFAARRVVVNRRRTAVGTSEGEEHAG